MDHVKMSIEESKQGTVYAFGFAYTTKDQEIKWHDNVVVADRKKDNSWEFKINTVKNMSQSELETYRTLMNKVAQVVDTNAMNLSGIRTEKAK